MREFKILRKKISKVSNNFDEKCDLPNFLTDQEEV